ncbi:MAG: 2-succinyl-6-hydroxy-2,4-cyclohexadiene-1-carboxylate synthase [Syntrophales bacterium]|nr:2-succinyl-6-hydroxy-2,4-cyclohexadiene-1-carboxylate synthase [Syntrophales bacterium]
MTKTVLNYREYGRGKGDVLVFLHGFMGNARSLEPLAEPLSRTRRCLAFDLPGHGKSLFDRIDPERRLKNMDDVARLVLRDLDALGVDRFRLYGYSMGGRIAQCIALTAPKRIDGLILESASFGIADPEERRQRYLRDLDLLAGIETKRDFEEFLKRWHDLPLFCSLRGTPHREAMIQEKLDNSIADLRRAMEILSVGNQPFYGERLANIPISIYYLCGEKDEAYRATATTVRERMPRMNVREFAGASHNIHVQFPKEIVRTLEDII